MLLQLYLAIKKENKTQLKEGYLIKATFYNQLKINKMSKDKIISNFSRLSDAELNVQATSIAACLTNNNSFTFANGEVAALTAATTKFYNKLAALTAGSVGAVAEKNAARADLIVLLSTIAIQVNLQANGDLVKLQSSGFPLVKHPERRVQPVPSNLKVVNGNNGEMLASVDNSAVGDNGTIFAYTPATNTVTDANLWMLKHANKHSITIKGLTPGVAYKFTAAYKGNDDDDLVWADPITKFAGN